jgi:predicted membrane protein
MNMERNKMKRHSHSKPGFLVGLVLIIVGILYLLFNFGWMDGGLKPVFFSWQMLLILIGIVSMANRHFMSGFILAVTGGFFLIPRLAVAYPDVFYWAGDHFVQTCWPVLLIIAGVLILLSWAFNPAWKKNEDGSQSFCYIRNHKRKHRPGGQFGKYDRNTVFGAIEEIILDPEFTGADLNAVFGGIELDLRKTSLPEGETFIELNTICGGVVIYVPETWNVELHLDNVIFGAIEDKRRLVENVDYSRKLIISAACIFGGGEIKN